MKQTIAILLTMIMVIFSFAACGTTPQKPDENDASTLSQTQSDVIDTNSKAEESTPADTTPEKEDTKDDTQTSTPEKEEVKNETPDIDYAPGNNYFLNENNNFYDQNAVSVRPKYVYWHDGKLIAECFVVNGFAHPVFNIEVNSFSLSNKDGVIAQGAFGKLNNVVLQPYTHVEWTFTFSPDCIAKYGADITSLIYNSNVTNNY